MNMQQVIIQTAGTLTDAIRQMRGFHESDAIRSMRVATGLDLRTWYFDGLIIGSEDGPTVTRAKLVADMFGPRHYQIDYDQSAEGLAGAAAMVSALRNRN
jgi:hypothetical protein